MKAITDDFFLTFLLLSATFFVYMILGLRANFFAEEVKKTVSTKVVASHFSPEIFKQKKTRLIVTGDVMLGRTVMNKSIQENDFNYPFRKVFQKLKEADIVFINLENPVIKNCPQHDSGFKLCAKPEMVEGLTFAGVDIVTLANNHARDYGESGVAETVSILGGIGIKTTGLGGLVTINHGDNQFGFLGFNFITKKPSEQDLKLIEESAAYVDVLVVGIHWGEEYVNHPMKEQKNWAKEIVKRGADVVVGHHPHWIQDFEYIKPDNVSLSEFSWSRPVYYSLGNFVFDQMWSEETKRGLVVELVFEEGIMTSDRLLPVYISNWAQPEFID